MHALYEVSISTSSKVNMTNNEVTFNHKVYVILPSRRPAWAATDKNILPLRTHAKYHTIILNRVILENAS